MDTIGSRIREYRLLRGMTQQDIADALGESSGRVIYNWEKGIGRPDCDKLARLCDLLGVSADELIGCKSMAGRPTATEWGTLQKYRALDEHGKEVVDYLIDSEDKRVTVLTRKPKSRMLKID
jgi:transcriptional regulator with XRE-family HTH domain